MLPLFARVPTWIIDAGVLATSTIAVITCITLLSRSRPGRWLVNQIREDLAEARREEIISTLDEQLPKHLEPVLYELRTNGGGSFRDDVTVKLDQVAEFMEHSKADRDDLRRLFEDEISRTHRAQRGEIDDRTEEP